MYHVPGKLELIAAWFGVEIFFSLCLSSGPDSNSGGEIYRESMLVIKH